MLLVPCVFAWPSLLVDTSPQCPTLIYSPRGVGQVWDGSARSSAPSLADLLGRSRAALLARLDLPLSTTQVARDLGLSAASVSEHLSVLRRSRLVSSRRSGRQVLYQRTALGTDLLGAASGSAPGKTRPFGENRIVEPPHRLSSPCPGRYIGHEGGHMRVVKTLVLAAAMVAVTAGTATASASGGRCGGGGGWEPTSTPPFVIPAGDVCSFEVKGDIVRDREWMRTPATYPDGSPKVQDFKGVLVIRYTNTSNHRSVVRDATGPSGCTPYRAVPRSLAASREQRRADQGVQCGLPRR